MPQVCSVCTHPKSKDIDLAIIRGASSNRKIATRHGLVESALRSHRANHLAERYSAARESTAEKLAVDLQTELNNCFEYARKLRAACDKWLTDPDDETKYTLGARASEVKIVFDEYDHRTKKEKRKRASLETLLHRLEQKRGLDITVERMETRVADPRKLNLEVLDRYDRLMRMRGDLTGEFKQPQDNPVDDKARVERAIDMWIEECK